MSLSTAIVVAAGQALFFILGMHFERWSQKRDLKRWQKKWASDYNKEDKLWP